jgi:general secretion pathway protein D
MSKYLIVLFAGLLLVTAPVQAQDPTIVVPTESGFLVDFQDQELRLVLSALAQAGGLNVSFSNIPNRRTTLRMGQPIPRDQIRGVMRSIVESNGLRMIDDGSLIRIEAASAAQQRATTVQPNEQRLFVHRLKHANATQLAPTLMSLFGGVQVRGPGGQQTTFTFPGGVTVPGGGQGNVIIREQSEAAAAAGELAATVMDRLLGGGRGGGGGGGGGGDGGRGGGGGGGGIALGAQRAAMVAQAQQAASGSLSMGEVRIVAEESTNSLLVRASPADWEIVQQIIQTVDLRPLQVLIEVTIAEVRRTNDLNIGISGSASRTRAGETSPDASATLPAPDPISSARDFVLRLTGGRGTIDFDVAINALATRGDVRILALPIIIAQNNRQAILNVGSRRPFVSVTQTVPNDPTGRVQTIQYLDVATRLTITPTINPDGYVNLQVNQTANSATNEIAFDAPVLSTREATTQVFVRDGQTTVIGGLADNTRDNVRSGIPILSRIPIIGGLFGSTRNTHTTSELFLFLTPHVVFGDDDVDRLRDAVRDGTVLLKQVPVDPIIPPAPADTISPPLVRPLPPPPAR